MQTNTRKRIAIVGAGVSGLSAAVELVQSRAEVAVTIVDSREQVGGLLRTTVTEDSLMEQSADMFTTKLPFALKLCQTIGYQAQLIPTQARNRGAKLATRTGLQPIPAGFSLLVPKQTGSVMRSPILSVAGKLRLLAEPIFLLFNRRYRMGLDAIPTEDDESLQDFAVRHWGQDAFRKIIQPLVAGIYTADPAKLSMKAALAEFVELERQHGRLLWTATKEKRSSNEADGDFQDALSAGGRKEANALGDSKAEDSDRTASGARYGLFLTPRNGMQHWMESIAEWLLERNCQFQLGCTLSSVRQLESEWHLDSDHPLVKRFDAVILATPVQKASQLLEQTQPDLSSELAAIESASAAIVVAMVDRSLLPNRGQGLGFGVVVPEYLGRPTIACSFSSHKFPGRSTEDKLLIRCFFGGAMHPERMLESDESLIRLATTELQELLSAPKLQLQEAKVVRWEQAMPQYHVGHLDRVEKIESLVNSIRGLGIAGNAYRGVGIPQCIDSGEKAARKVLSDLAFD